MTTTATQTQLLTYEEYLDTPEIKRRFDIVDGEMIMAPSPIPNHQITSRQFFLVLHQFIVERNLGILLYAPLDIVIRRNPLRTRQPDLLLLSNESFARIYLDRPIEVAPELAIEILSPSNTRRRVQDALADYAAIGVRECWLVSIRARTIEALTLVNGEWRRLALLGVGDKMRSEALAGLDVEVGQFFV